HRTMVQATLLSKSPSLPTPHSRRDHSYMINGSALHRHVSADRFETFAAKHLACSRHVLDVHEPIVVSLTRQLPKWCSYQSQRSISRQFPNQECKIVGFE